MISIKTNRRLDASMNMTPIIDIVFLLLIFFMLTTNFITEEGIKVNLPHARSTTPQTDEDITVFVDKEGWAYIKGIKISHERLFDELRRLIGNNTEKLVVVKADREVILNKAVKVMDIAKDAGAAKLCIATEEPMF